MAIWKQEFNLEGLEQIAANTMVSTLGIKFIEVGDDYIKASMPVNENTVQPLRLLHGGASVALAETMGSMASFMCLEDTNTQNSVGLEINANHLRATFEGSTVIGTCRPVRLGRTIHVWNIEIHDQNERLVCVSRLTMAITQNK